MSGAEGSNECPAGSVRIETEAACRTAVAAAGKTPFSRFVQTDPDYPRGCYYSTFDNYAYLNTHAVGGGFPYLQPLCAALVTTGAPLHAPMRTTRVLKRVLTAAAKVLRVLAAVFVG